MCSTGFVAVTVAHITGYKSAGVLLATELQQRGVGAAFPVQLGKINSYLSKRALAELRVTRVTMPAELVLPACSSHAAIFLCLQTVQSAIGVPLMHSFKKCSQ